jgi:tRNA pseudouridine32 synthase/23S rRNA pseudouridine746 synthase
MIEVVFENENFVVCNKPARVLSVPAREKHDPRSCLGLVLQEKYKKPVFPVHRLDFEVSGLIIYALNSRAHKVSQDWFLKKTIRKMYLAQTSLQNFSHWPENIKTDRSAIDLETQKDFYWTTKIQRGKRRSFESDHGEWAETEAVVVQANSDSILWNLFPLTGKPHQLRFELSRHGFPIDGDQLYGSAVKINQDGILLRAVSLDLSDVHDKLGLPSKIKIEASFK